MSAPNCVIVNGGNNPLTGREENDYYATQPSSVRDLILAFNRLNLQFDRTILEPSVGEGNIAKEFQKLGFNVIGYDIVDRGWAGTRIEDFLQVAERPTYNPMTIVMNPPYKDCLQHIYKALEMLHVGEYCCAFLKIQFLETKKRRPLFEFQPPKYVAVFSERQQAQKNNEEAKNRSAMCFCWFIWEKGFTGRPQLLWI